MKPTLFSTDLPVLGEIVVPAYIVFFLLGAFVALLVARQGARIRALDHKLVIDTALLALAAGIIGARIFSVVADGHAKDFWYLCAEPARVEAGEARSVFCQSNADCGWDYVCDADARSAVVKGERTTMCHEPRDCLAAVKFWRGGLTNFGGVLLAIPLCFWFVRRRGKNPLVVADVLAPALMAGEAIGRFACFFNGCCLGSATTWRWGHPFPGEAVARHPTQLLESLAAVITFFVLRFFLRNERTPSGAVFAALLIVHSGLRLPIGFLRAERNVVALGLSASQWSALLLIAAGSLLLRRIVSPREPAK